MGGWMWLSITPGLPDLKMPTFRMTRRELRLPIGTQCWQQISMVRSLVASTRYERCATAARAPSSTYLRAPGLLAFLGPRHTQPARPRFETTPRQLRFTVLSRD